MKKGMWTPALLYCEHFRNWKLSNCLRSLLSGQYLSSYAFSCRRVVKCRTALSEYTYIGNYDFTTVMVKSVRGWSAVTPVFSRLRAILIAIRYNSRSAYQINKSIFNGAFWLSIVVDFSLVKPRKQAWFISCQGVLAKLTFTLAK